MTAPLSLPIHVRAYVPDGNKPKSGRGHAPQASQWSIVFDCETTVDAAQQLRFGTYQLRKGGTIREQGYFYEESALSREELAMLRATAAKQGVKAISKDAFVETVLYRMGYELRALIIGFNLPFDISRLAIGHGRAKRGMTGGFTFQLSQNPNLARIQIRHLSRRAAFIQFAGIGRQRLARSERKRGVSRESRRGHFVDLNTLASALFSKSFNLASLCDHLSTKTRKLSTGEHGQKLTPEYLKYAMTDTQATWECYVELARHFEENFGLKDLALESIYSEASLGKAFLKAMNIKPWRVCQPDFPDEITGQILSAYYGGRSEVRIRRDIRQVLYCDFLSMYPTVCTLMGLWRFVIADGVTWRDATDETRALLASIGPDDLQSPDFWKCLRVLVQVQADNDLFPVRAAYGDGPQATIGLNRLTSDAPLWFTLADCIVSTLLSGKPPTIIRAIEFLPGEPQTGLRPVTLPGGARIDPEKEDFYRAIIDRRQEIKAQLKEVSGERRGELDIAQNSLKIIANATSYGSFVEINVQDRTHERDALCHGPADVPFSLRVTKDEQPGLYFHPLLATLITGAARLMLALTERQIIDAGLDWVLCDTDSMAIARPDAMSVPDFYARAKSICGWFEPLNPYRVKGPVLKIEAANYALDGTGELEPLHALAVSAKRYALFNLRDDGSGNVGPVIRKASAHGLGHFRDPYSEDDAPGTIPAPALSRDEIGVARWQHDIWYSIISAALSDRPEQVDLGFHNAMNGPAIARFAVTTPALHDWFKDYNRAKPYARQVKPFNFLASLVANRFSVQEPEIAGSKRPRKTPPSLRPIAPFDTDPDVIASRAFDRITGEPVPREALKTFAQSLAQYHFHPEDKFEGGDFGYRGETTRRHIHAAAIIFIGKEANRWEEQEALGFDPNQHPDYGLSPDDMSRIRAAILDAIERTSAAAVAKAADLTPRTLKSIIADGTSPHEWQALAIAAEKVASEFVEAENAKAVRVGKLRGMVKRFGLSRVAQRIGMDKSNLRRMVGTKTSCC